MWSIAICDDDKRDCYNLEEMLEAYCKEKGVAAELDSFYDGCSLYEVMKLGKQYDLIFLDILMAGMDGIMVGKEIRRALDNEEVQIVYMSYSARNAEVLFESRPIRFLKKPLRENNVFQIADYARKLSFRSAQQFLYQKKKILYQVPYEKILYFQSCGRKIEIHMTNEKSEFYGKLSEILQKGLPEQFVQIHQSYIVNKDYIEELASDRVYLKGEKGYFSISKTFRQTALMRLRTLLMPDFAG